MLNGTNSFYIGNGVRICAHARIEAITSYAGVSKKPKLIIEDNVLINQNFHCTCAEYLRIGEGTSITANCGVFDIVHPYEDTLINPRRQKIKTKPIEIGKHCVIGMNSVILPGAILGDHVIVGCNCTVREGYYPSYSVLAGSPAKIVKRYDEIKKQWLSVK